MSRILFLLVFLHAFSFAYSQIGDLPITNHRPSVSGLENSGFEIDFDSLGLMYVASNAGVLQYDGIKWDKIETPKAAFSLDVDSDNRIYVGCSGSFGYLDLTGSGVAYQLLSPDSLGNEHFISTQVIGDSVVFLSATSLWVYQPSSKSLNSYSSPDRFSMTAVVNDGNQIFVSTEISSFAWDGNQMTSSEKWVGDNDPPGKIEVSPNSENYLILDTKGNLFRSTGNVKLNPVLSAGQVINDFEWIDDESFVVSTRNQGCMIVSAENYEVISQIDYASGLPDDEIKTLKVDRDQGVWLGHSFGFSRVDTKAPVYCLSNQGGLEGHLIKSVSFKDQLLVGTSSGLFRSKLDSVFSMTTSRKRIKVKSSSTKKTSKLFKRKETKTKTSYRYITQEEKKFEYAKWRYERLGGVNYKCNDFYVLGDVLLIGTNGGLFEYDGVTLNRILDRPVRKIEELPSKNEFLIIDEYSANRYIREPDEYTELPFGYDESLILSAYGDEKGLLWLIGPGKLTSVGLTIYGASVFDENILPNDHLEKPTIGEIDNELIVVTNAQYLRYDYKNKTLVEDADKLGKWGVPKRHIQDKNGTFWAFDGKVWKYINEEGTATTYSYLSLYPNISAIEYEQESDEIYFVSEDGQLFCYQPSDDNNEINPSNIFYKHLFAQSSYSAYKSEISLPYDENYLRAEISQPDYLGLLKVEYQYKLEGVDKEWSPWSSNNQIDLTFLPEGNHELQVRSRDLFDRVQYLDPVAIVIDPPYWRKTWFYLIEVCFFAFLVWISTRLNQGSASNRFLTEGLTVLTVVLIIETLQSIAGSYLFTTSSPIIDFLINLAIALVIFPLELLLKRIIKGRRSPRVSESAAS